MQLFKRVHHLVHEVAREDEAVLRRDHLDGRLEGADLANGMLQRGPRGHVDLMELGDAGPVGFLGEQMRASGGVQTAKQVAAEEHT